jgi:hypothetical protein
MKNLLFGLSILPLLSFISLTTVDNIISVYGEGFTGLNYCDTTECIEEGSMTPTEIAIYLLDKRDECNGPQGPVTEL